MTTSLKAQGVKLKADGKPTASSLEPRASQDLVFEIGTEELPAAYLPSLIEQLGVEAAALLTANHLPFTDIKSDGTPRRLVLIVLGLAATQHRPGSDVRGPSKQAAYDKTGNPTPALTGFLRSQGGTLNDTKLVSSEKGEYVYLVKPPTATATSKVLPQLLPQLISALRAPKTMRWDATGTRFARPIRWLLACYGSTTIRCSYGALTSAAKTWVGGPTHPRAVPVASLSRYHAALRNAGVILEQERRMAQIRHGVARAATQAGGRPAPEMLDHGLLEEVTHLVEAPVPLVARCDPAYLSLPREVLLASMAKYQRVFAIEAGGAISSQCVAILEGKPGKPAAVRAVIERILNARLADSAVFVKADLARTPSDMNRELTGVTFHEKLGSMADKVRRLCGLSQTLAGCWALTPKETAQLAQACEWSKFDLVSHMVREFPTLQGVMGKRYLLAAGKDRLVAEAIGEQYLPAGGKLPQTLIGSALALLDQYDTLASYFSVGIEPTGDQDPFGLRRAAQGVVEMTAAVRRPLPFEPLFTAWQSLAPFAKGKAQAGQRITQYLLERLYTFAWPPPIPSTEEIAAVLASPCTDLLDVMDRIASLQRLSGHPGLRKAAKVIERTRNILKGAALRQPQVDPARLTEAPERRLWELYDANASHLAALTQKKSYAEATIFFGDLFFEPLHQFFDQVLVNVPDEPLQQNRLALMRAIHTLYTERIADLSKLTRLQHEEPS